MTYGTVALKNGKRKGRLHFTTGKTIKLNPKEVVDFETWVRFRKEIDHVVANPCKKMDSYLRKINKKGK